MTNLSLQAKVGLAALGLGALAVVWMMTGNREPGSGTGAQPSGGGERSKQIEQRLAELGAQRHAEPREGLTFAGVRQQATGVDAVPRKPHEPPADEAAAESRMDESDRANFEFLKEVALKPGDTRQRVKALWLMTTYEDAPIVPILKSALSDADREVRLAAVQELSGLAEGTPLDLVAFAMDDPDPEIRLEALSALDELADEDGQQDRLRPLIEKALTDPDEDVRSEAQDLAGIDDDSNNDADTSDD